MSYPVVNSDPIATILAARQRQIQSLAAMRSGLRSSYTPQPSSRSQRGDIHGGHAYGPSSYQGWYPGDRVTLGSEAWGGGYADDTRLANGQTIEDVFANPYADDPEMAALMQDIAKLAQAGRLGGARSPKEAQKGELRVIAGNRSDGVKPKEVRIDEHNGYDTTREENNYHDNRTETRKDGKIGTEYDVTVTWEDGTTTQKRVTLKQSNQIIYMDSAYSY